MKIRNFGILAGIMLLTASNSPAIMLESENETTTKLISNYEWNINREGFDYYPPKVVGPTVPAIWNYYPGATVFDPVLTEPTPAPVPEPATMLLFGMGLVVIGVAMRKKIN